MLLELLHMKMSEMVARNPYSYPTHAPPDFTVNPPISDIQMNNFSYTSYNQFSTLSDDEDDEDDNDIHQSLSKLSLNDGLNIQNSNLGREFTSTTLFRSLRSGKSQNRYLEARIICSIAEGIRMKAIDAEHQVDRSNIKLYSYAAELWSQAYDLLNNKLIRLDEWYAILLQFEDTEETQDYHNKNQLADLFDGIK